jgi:hypothetical protein
MKKCNKCLLIKPLSDFGKYCRSKDGLQYNCLICNRKIVFESNAKRRKNPDIAKKLREDSLKRYHEIMADPIKRDAYLLKKKSTINVLKQREWSKKYNKKSSTKEKNKLSQRKYRENPLNKFISNIRTLIGRSIKYKGFKKLTKTEIILGCSFDEFREYIQLQFKEGMSFSNHGEWEIDHIIPISNAKTEQEVISLNHYKNLMPLWKIDNRIKGNKSPVIQF